MIRHVPVVCHNQLCELRRHGLTRRSFVETDRGAHKIVLGDTSTDGCRGRAVSATQTIPMEPTARLRSRLVNIIHHFTCNRALVTLLLAAAMCGACAQRHPLPHGAMDQHWLLHENPWPQAQQRPEPAGRGVASQWIIRRNDNVIISTISIIQAMGNIERGCNRVEMSISPEHARVLADQLAQARMAMEQLRDMVDATQAPTPQSWSLAVGKTLVGVERIARLIYSENGAEQDQAPHPWQNPLYQAVIEYINRSGGGTLLTDIRSQDVQRVREVFTQSVLKVAFAAASKQMPESLREQVTELMLQSADPAQLESELTPLLAEVYSTAPPAPSDTQLVKVLRTVLTWTPRILLLTEDLLHQWENIDQIAVEFRQFDGRGVTAITLDVRPGQELAIRDVVPFQPVLAFRGRMQVIVLPKDATRQSVILLEPLESGSSATLRFEGLVLALGKMVSGIPLESGAVREVRITSSEPRQGREMSNVALLMLASGHDPRRIIVYQNVAILELLRQATNIDMIDAGKTHTVSYVAPRAVYTIEHKSAKTQN